MNIKNRLKRLIRDYGKSNNIPKYEIERIIEELEFEEKDDLKEIKGINNAIKKIRTLR